MRFDDQLLSRWKQFSSAEPSQLIDARLQLHHAAQIVGAIGRYLVPPRPDDSNTSFYWDAERQAFFGETVGDEVLLRGGLRPADLTLLLHDEKRKSAQELQLTEISIGEALFWIENQLEEANINVDPLTIEMPYILPEHPVSDGKPFNLHNELVFEELSCYWANADLLLKPIAQHSPKASPVRCWPHHFDVATLITVEEHEDADQSRTIGVGLSPGDDQYALPYFYVTPWPYSVVDAASLPELEGNGEWHTEGWVGAVLTSHKLSRVKSSEGQFELASSFLESAVSAARKLLK